VFLNEDEWQVLWAYAKKEPLPVRPPEYFGGIDISM
jgi:hypothetical protein